ncbi:hypothetical protein [Pseudotenacibaculum haliotis]|uniref:Uncharacterized protein n=1 Tax=Pseudotenacibaculum haliotis TaxID=1862138 RepID=A0ABW5LWH9_9FLAO
MDVIRIGTKMSLTINHIVLFLVGMFFCVSSFSQEPIDVANLSIKLSFDQTQDYYYSFDTGDEIVFNFQMKKGRHFKYVEIASPTNVISTEFKAKKIANQRIKVLNKGVYRFRFYSSSLTNRVANVNIQRVPSSIGRKSFNTGWRWERVIDTAYIPYVKDSLTGYKITPYQETVKELIEAKEEEVLLFQKSQRVHSFYNRNKSKTYLRVDLPRLENTVLKSERLIAWAYWIGVGNEGKEAYEQNIKSFSNLIANAADAYCQTPLAGLAVGTITDLILPSTGEDVDYSFVNDYQNVQNFLNGSQYYLFDSGKGRAAFGRNDSKKHGTFYICLYNDNLTRGIDVDVKVVAVKETKLYEFRKYNKQRKEPQYVKLNKIRMQITEKKYRVPVE